MQRFGALLLLCLPLVPGSASIAGGFLLMAVPPLVHEMLNEVSKHHMFEARCFFWPATGTVEIYQQEELEADNCTGTHFCDDQQSQVLSYHSNSM